MPGRQGQADRGAPDRGQSRQAAAEVRSFAQRLSPEERLLIVLKRELYEGDWANMAADLKARLAGRPFVFKLASRITDDLRRIEALRAFEQATGVDLGEYVTMEP